MSDQDKRRALLTFAHGVDLALGKATGTMAIEASLYLTGALDAIAEEAGLPKEYRSCGTCDEYVAGRNAALLYLTSEERNKQQ